MHMYTYVVLRNYLGGYFIFISLLPICNFEECTSEFRKQYEATGVK